ncbi:MAG: hypothetical protein UY87_C0016G0013 [Candidatus Peribacteria bacterium GW2011_GWC2_54_8]|nr:MAG: hypothetical protein UY87_C0016G0013 [Candidatus Peribacteria bacterium GW2011_GWC2_54_8]
MFLLFDEEGDGGELRFLIPKFLRFAVIGPAFYVHYISIFLTETMPNSFPLQKLHELSCLRRGNDWFFYLICLCRCFLRGVALHRLECSSVVGIRRDASYAPLPVSFRQAHGYIEFLVSEDFLCLSVRCSHAQENCMTAVRDLAGNTCPFEALFSF